MYHFLSGYTAKVAGTEVGVTEPQVTFSACFGAPFMPLPPTEYAEMLAEKVQQHGVRIWLVNTGWTGGGYGVGTRMKLKYTRAMIRAAMNGALDGAALRDDVMREVDGERMQVGQRVRDRPKRRKAATDAERLRRPVPQLGDARGVVGRPAHLWCVSDA